MRVSNFGQNIAFKMTIQLIRGSTYTRVYTVIFRSFCLKKSQIKLFAQFSNGGRFPTKKNFFLKEKFGLKIGKSDETFYSFSKIYQILGSKLACFIHNEVNHKTTNTKVNLN